MAHISKCLIIVGMHRSGTSYTASVLKQSGLDIGDRLVGAGIGNDLGHFENEDFHTYHKKILEKRHYHSDGWSLSEIDTFDSEETKEALAIIAANQSEQWGWKDPRTTLFLDAWKKLIPDAYFLFIYRKPWEVIESLFRRNQDKELITTPILTIENWQFYNEKILSFFNQNKDRSILIEIENIMQRSTELIDLINNRFGFQLNGNFETFFDKTKFKNHLNERQQLFCESFFPSCITLYNQLRNKSSIAPLTPYKPSTSTMESLLKWWYDSSHLSVLNKEFEDYKIKTAAILNDLQSANHDLNVTNKSLKAKIQELTAANNYLQEDINWITSSKWWRLRKWFK